MFLKSTVVAWAVIASVMLCACQGSDNPLFNWLIKPVSYPNQSLASITPKTTLELERFFEAANYVWPVKQSQVVPPLVIQSLPPDFPQVENMAQKKALFLRALLPLVLIENQKLRNQRQIILRMLTRPKSVPQPGSLVEQALDRLTRRYRVEQDNSMKKGLAKLLIRLDEIPPSLVLAQAVIESGWGSSRFALQGNSLFGEWTYHAEQGLAPRDRDADKSHFVRVFPDIYSSMRSYMNNLNTGKAYLSFRIMRAEMRRKQQPLRSLDLAIGLNKYSAKGREYVDYVRKVILVNDLRNVDELSLALQVY
jgi:Bax protein